MIRIGQVQARLSEAEIAEGWTNIGQQSGPWFVDTVTEVSEAMVTLAMIRIMVHRLIHPNRKRLPAPGF